MVHWKDRTSWKMLPATIANVSPEGSLWDTRRHWHHRMGALETSHSAWGAYRPDEHRVSTRGSALASCHGKDKYQRGALIGSCAVGVLCPPRRRFGDPGAHVPFAKAEKPNTSWEGKKAMSPQSKNTKYIKGVCILEYILIARPGLGAFPKPLFYVHGKPRESTWLAPQFLYRGASLLSSGKQVNTNNILGSKPKNPKFHPSVTI